VVGQLGGAAGLDATVARGLRWALVRQAITGLASTAGVLAYTRLLQPEDLGAVALAFLVYNGLILLVQAPIRDAVVYYQEREQAHGSAAFWLLVGFSTAAGALVMATAGRLGRFYRSPDAAGLTRGMAVAFFFQAVAVVPAGLLLKRFRFAVHEGLQTVLILILLAGWVALARLGFGPWSLVLPQVAGAVFWAASAWIAAGFRPTLRPGREAYRDIVRFSRSLFGNMAIVYLKTNIDNAAAGTLGEGPLGWYSFGENQSTFVAYGVGGTVAQVALPAMAAVQERIEKLGQVYLDMLRLTATLSTPMQIGAIVLADLGIGLFFGEQWLGAVPVFRAYLAFRLVGTLLAISNTATSALGRPDIPFAVDLAQFPFFVGGIWFGLRIWGGIAGVAWSLAIVRIVTGLVYFGVTMRATRVRAGKTLRYLAPSSLAGAAMGIVVWVLRGGIVPQGSGALGGAGVGHRMAGTIAPPLLADGLSLLGLTLAGAISYFVILLAVDRAGFRAVAKMGWQIVAPEPVRARIAASWSRKSHPSTGSG